MSDPTIERRQLDQERHQQRVEMIEARHRQNLAALRVIGLGLGLVLVTIAAATLSLVYVTFEQHRGILAAQQDTAEAIRLNAVSVLTPTDQRERLTDLVIEGLNPITRDRVRKRLGYIPEGDPDYRRQPGRDTGAVIDHQGGRRRP